MTIRSRTALLMVLAAAGLVGASWCPGAWATYPGKNGKMAMFLIRQDPTGGKTAGIFLQSRPRGIARQLTNGETDGEMSFSPSGRQLVFSRASGNPYTGEPARSEIFQVGVDGSNLRRLTSGSRDFDPAIGRDGVVVFERFSPLTGTFRIFLRRRDGSIRQLTQGAAEDASPVFTPDGRRILFVRGPARGQPIDPRVFQVDLDGKHERALPGRRSVEPIAGFQTAALDISPDGRQLSVLGMGRTSSCPSCAEATAGNWLEPLAGGAARLVDSGAGSGGASFSPDGRNLIYTVRFTSETTSRSFIGRVPLPLRGEHRRYKINFPCPNGAATCRGFGVSDVAWQPRQ
jgi:dipeptidyl aminopeptidase/acylaminoacyl peptidase